MAKRDTKTETKPFVRPTPSFIVGHDLPAGTIGTRAPAIILHTCRNGPKQVIPVFTLEEAVTCAKKHTGGAVIFELTPVEQT